MSSRSNSVFRQDLITVVESFIDQATFLDDFDTSWETFRAPFFSRPFIVVGLTPLPFSQSVNTSPQSRTSFRIRLRFSTVLLVGKSPGNFKLASRSSMMRRVVSLEVVAGRADFLSEPSALGFGPYCKNGTHGHDRRLLLIKMNACVLFYFLREIRDRLTLRFPHFRRETTR